MATDTRTAETPAVITPPETPAGETQVRSARQRARAAGSARAVDRAAERVADTGRGWLLLTADNVRDITSAGLQVGREYLGTDAGLVAAAALDRVARWIGRVSRGDDELSALPVARLAVARGPSGYAARVARLAARQYASSRGTGRGSMPRLVLSDDELDERLAAVYGARSHSVAVATAARVDSSELDDVELGPRVAAAYWHAVLVGVPAAYRAISDDELEQLRAVSRHERTAAAPSFSRWLDAFGDSVPTAGNAHTFAHVAPGIPERDSGPTRRGSLRERLAAVGTDAETIRAAVAALDAVNTRRVSDDGARVGAYPRRVAWKAICADLGTDAPPATMARRVTAALQVLAAGESNGAEVYANDTATSQTTRVVAVPTGRVSDTADKYAGLPVTYSTTPPRAYTAGQHAHDAAAVANGAGEYWNEWSTHWHRATYRGLDREFQYGGDFAACGVAAWRDSQ